MVLVALGLMVAACAAGGDTEPETANGQLDLERHGGRTRPGVCARVLQRIL